MKKVLFSLTIIGTSFFSSPIFSQQNAMPDSLGLPGDNLNLYGVLDIFQHSKTLEEFETKLNAQDSKINNLDLNGDNQTDYIKVVDNMQGTAHAIVLQDAVNDKETQDVAVIEVEKDAKNQIHVQVVGDEQLYGKNYIVEPKDETAATSASTGATPNPGYTGPPVVNNTTNNYYNSGGSVPVANEVVYPVATWGIWDFLFAPVYVPYYSPYRWGYYPTYWRPWRPLYWRSYYGYNRNYYGYYNRGSFYRAPLAHGYYSPRRSTSAFVGQRRATGAYNSTYSRRSTVSHNSGVRSQTRSSSPSRSGVSQNRGTRMAPATRSNVQSNHSAVHSSGPATRNAAPRGAAPSGGNRGGGGRSSGGGGHSSGASHGGGRK